MYSRNTTELKHVRHRLSPPRDGILLKVFVRLESIKPVPYFRSKSLSFPISNQDHPNLYPFSDQNLSKAIGAHHERGSWYSLYKGVPSRVIAGQPVVFEKRCQPFLTRHWEYITYCLYFQVHLYFSGKNASGNLNIDAVSSSLSKTFQSRYFTASEWSSDNRIAKHYVLVCGRVVFPPLRTLRIF